MAIDLDNQSEQEALDEIVQEGRNVLARMDAVKARFDAVGADIDKICSIVQQSHDSLARMLEMGHEQVQKTVQHFQEHIDELEKEGAEFLGPKMDGWGAELDQARSDLQQSNDERHATAESSHGVLDDLKERVDEVADKVEERVKQTLNDIKEHSSALSQRFDAATDPAMNRFNDFLADLQQQAEGFIDETKSNAEVLQEKTDQLINEHLVHNLSEHVAHASEFLANVGAHDVGDAVTQLAAQGREVLENQIKAVITDLVDHAAQGFDQVTEAINKAGGDNNVVREALRPVFDIVQDLIGPVSETMGNVSSVAGAVGYEVNVDISVNVSVARH